ncbi:MAG: DNA polymerase III subunit delta [Acutalibacteraceae bacterium]|jgi:DNA polymerase-3 subunit delta
MPVVYESSLKRDLSSKKLLPVYILFGDDAFLKQMYLDKISRSVTDPDDVFNYCKFTGQCDLQDVYDAAVQLPLMSERKCVILNDYDFDAASRQDFDRLITLISEIPDTTVMIFYFDSVETDIKNGARFKRLVTATEKRGGAAVLLNHRSRGELVKMLSDGAAKRGCRMDSATAGYLIDTAGDDINILKNELEKLCAFVGSGQISKATVDEISVKTIEANIYRLSDLILSCNSTSALGMLDELFYMRLEPMVIFYTISSVFVDMYRLYAANQQGLKAADVAKTFGYGNKAFLLEKAANNLKKFDFKRLNLCLSALTDADRELKSFGREGRTVLEQLIVGLIYIIAKGETIDKA